MAQKFTSLDEAARQLGVSKDRLNQLREAGKVRGYRDGASWKFRSEDIDKLAADGIPAVDPMPSDIDLGSSLSLDLDDRGGSSPAASGSDIELAEDVSPPGPATSDLSLEDIDEPTVPVVAGDDDSEEVLSLDPDDDLLNLSDSILLSETELGGVSSRPPSTIIGKVDLDPEGDLDLTLQEESTAMSDVKLAATSDVLAGGDSLEMEQPADLSDNFKGLAEVDVDLEAQSSRILSPGDADKVKAAAKAAAEPAPSSNLELAPTDSDLGLAGSAVGKDEAAGGITGLSALELAEDDDQVLGEGSDIALSAESSGINIISPSDSGLALDEVALSSASMSSPLDLGGAMGSDVALEPLELSEDEMEGEEAFQLTPLGEEDEEEKDSSQVIALDEIDEEAAAPVFQVEPGDEGLGADFATAGLVPGAMPVAVATTEDLSMPGWVFAILSINLFLLLICGMMAFDLVRNIWSWDEVSTVNSWLLEVVNPLL
jgi:excisionase family DNA binding protein